MTILQQRLAENMRCYRKILHLSQSQLAEGAETSTNYIALIETGKKFPSHLMLERIAQALHITSPELFSQKNIEQDFIESLERAIINEVKNAISAFKK